MSSTNSARVIRPGGEISISIAPASKRPELAVLPLEGNRPCERITDREGRYLGDYVFYAPLTRFLFAAIQCDDEEAITSCRPKVGCRTACWDVCFNLCSAVSFAICVLVARNWISEEGRG